MSTKIENKSFTIDNICNLSNIKVPISTEPVAGAVEIVEKCSKIKDNKEAQQTLRELFIKIGLDDEEIIEVGLKELADSRKIEESVFDSDRCTQKLRLIQHENIEDFERSNYAIDFFNAEILDKVGDKIKKILFVENVLCDYFSINKSNTNKILKYCKDELSPKKVTKRSSSSKNAETIYKTEDKQETVENCNKEQKEWEKYILPSTVRGWYEINNQCITRNWTKIETDENGKEQERTYSTDVSRTPFIIFGKTQQLIDGTVYYGFRYKYHNTQKEIMIKKTDLQPKNKLKETLAKYDINVTDEMVRETEDFISRYIHKFGEHLNIVKTNTANGWNEDSIEFFLGEHVITKDGTTKVHTAIETDKFIKPFHTRGSQEEWCKAVEEALKFDIVRFMFYDGMDAPLIKVLKVNDAQVTVLYGPTSHGKTFITHLVSSTMGKANNTKDCIGLEFVVYDSPNPIVAHVAGMNDMPVDLEEATGEEKAKLVSKTCYSLTNGTEKARSEITGKLRNDTKSFRAQVQITGENPLRDYIPNAGGKYRINDIGGVDLIPNGNGELVSRLKCKIYENYGFFFPLYIQKIIQNKDRIHEMYKLALTKIDSDFSNIPEESRAVAERSKQTFAMKIVSGYLCEELFKEMKMSHKSKEDVEKVVNYFYRKCVIDSPVEPDWKRALRYLVDTIVSERSRFYNDNNNNNNEYSEDTISKLPCLGTMKKNRVDIIGGMLHEILEKKGFSRSITTEWARRNVTESEHTQTITVGFGKNSTRASGYKFNINRIHEILEIRGDTNTPNSFNPKCDEIVGIVSAILEVKKSVSIEELNLIFESDIKEHINFLKNNRKLLVNPQGKFTLPY